MEFATKPELGRRMLERLLATHGREALGWFTADEAYGDNPGLRGWLGEQDLNHVMAISCDTHFTTPTGPRRADKLAASAPKRGWQLRHETRTASSCTMVMRPLLTTSLP